MEEKVELSHRQCHRESHTGFPLVPKSMTLNDLERRNGRYFALSQPNR